MNTSPYDNLLADVPTDLYIGGTWRPASDGAPFRGDRPRDSEAVVASVASGSIEDATRRRRCRSRGGRRLGGEEAPRARRDSRAKPSS